MSTAAMNSLAPVLELLSTGPGGSWRRATFSHPATAAWKKVVAEPVSGKQGPAVKVITSAGSGQTTQTIPAQDWPPALQEVLSSGPRNIHVTTPAGEWHARHGKRQWLVSFGRPANESGSGAEPALAEHDRRRQHVLDPADPAVRELLTEVGIMSNSGQVRGVAAAKYRQVQHFLELLRPLSVLNRKRGRSLRIVDAGCGAAHLGLALYLYARHAGFEPVLTGIDRNAALVEKNNDLVKRLRFPGAVFKALDMANVAAEELGRVDILISLHLCDTATDDALIVGVRCGASAMVLAPCCQHELIPQLAGANLAPAEAVLVRQGTMRERMASLLTDQFRILALEAAGYRVDASDFTGPENTAKNLLIRADKRSASEAKREAARAAFETLAERWQVSPACAAALEGGPQPAVNPDEPPLPGAGQPLG